MSAGVHLSGMPRSKVTPKPEPEPKPEHALYFWCPQDRCQNVISPIIFWFITDVTNLVSLNQGEIVRYLQTTAVYQTSTRCLWWANTSNSIVQMILGVGVASFADGGWQMVRSVISVAVIIQMHLGVTISEQLSSASGATNWSAVKLFPILPFSLKFELHWPFKGILCQKVLSLKFHIGVWYSWFWLEGFQQNCKSTLESSALSKNIWCINTLHPSDLVLMEAFYNVEWQSL